MRRTASWSKLIALGVVFSLALAALAIGGVPRVVVASPIASVSSAYVNVTAVSFAFTPSLIENVTPSVTVHLNLLNAAAGGVAHTFTIYKREGVVIGQNPNSPISAVPGLLYGSGTYNGNLFNDNATGAGWFNMTFPAPAAGWYEFVCTEPGHFSPPNYNMYGFISFGVKLPPNLTVSLSPTGAGLAVFIIVGTIVTLTGIAIVLGFVVGRRRGSAHEMPPERVGYPEPSTPSGGPPLPPQSPPPPT